MGSCKIWSLKYPSPFRECNHHVFAHSLKLDDNKIKETEKTKSILNCCCLINSEWTLEEIGECWGLTRERIRQIERDAYLKVLKELKKRAEGLRNDFEIPFYQIVRLQKQLEMKKYKPKRGVNAGIH